MANKTVLLTPYLISLISNAEGIHTIVLLEFIKVFILLPYVFRQASSPTVQLD